MRPSSRKALVLIACVAVCSSNVPHRSKAPAAALHHTNGIRSGIRDIHRGIHRGLFKEPVELWTGAKYCLAGAACDWAARLICPRLRRFLALAAAVCTISPSLDPGRQFAARICKTLRSAARPFVLWWAGGRVARGVAATIFPQVARDLAFALRVAPILVRYHHARGHISARNRTGGYVFNTTERSAQWADVHEWGSVVARDLIRDLGGFYRKIGQITGTASQMMPPAWVHALAETMDDNPPIPAKAIKKVVASELRRSQLGANFDDVFQSFDFEQPVATASIAQVHRAKLRPGVAPFTDVAVKIVIPNNRKHIMGDLLSMARVCRFMQLVGLDGGIDMPTIVNAYLDIIPDEFDLRQEARKIRLFQSALLQKDAGRRNGSSVEIEAGKQGRHAASVNESCEQALMSVSRRVLQDKIALPDVVDNLACEKMLVMRWFEGVSFLDVLREKHGANDTRSGGQGGSQQPKLPPEVAQRFGNWQRVFKTLHIAWGAQVLALGEFHTDPHPGNIIFLRDGRLGILDWGQTKVLQPAQRHLVARCVLAMVDEDPRGIAKAIEDSGEFEMVAPSPALWALIAYTFFDTRWTPIAGINIYDLDNSMLNANGFVRNSREGFPLIRVIFLMRGLMDSCAVEASMIDHWGPFASAVLGRDAQRPSLARRGRKLVAQAATGAARRLPSKWVHVANGPAKSASSTNLVSMMQSVLDAQRSGEATKEQRSFVKSLLQ